MGSQHNYRFVFKKGLQQKFLLDVISKEKLTQRRLAKLLGVSRRGVRNWIKEDRLLPEYIFDRITELFPWSKSYYKHVLKKVPLNWGQIKGGRIRGKMKNNLTKADRIKGFREANKTTFKRKVIGPKGEQMYNHGEKKIAEFLIKNNFDYQYEPVVNLGERYAIPDFLVNGFIIERCGYSNWHVYWSNLRRKLRLFEKYKIGNVIVLIPKNHFMFAIKKLDKLKNLIILEEENIEILNKILKGPRAHNN